MSSFTTLGAAAAGTLLGVCAMGLMIKNDDQLKIQQKKK
jgi:hypothetical protein